MIIEAIVSTTFAENTWLVGNEDSRECIIIDPGSGFKRIKNKINNLDLAPQLLLNTHLHPDHLVASKELQDQYQIPNKACEYEKNLFNAFTQIAQGLGFKGLKKPEINAWLQDNDILEKFGFTIKVIHTPGHSPGSCCYLINEKHLFSGDTLFAGSIGRTDLPYGSAEQMRTSLQRIADLPIKTKIYPGHGQTSTLEKELNNNPYLI